MKWAPIAILLGLWAASAPACDVGPFQLYFASGSTSLSAESREILDYEADMFRLQAMESAKEQRVLVVAHTDRAGDRRLNQRLSQQRANRVAAYLVGKGVPRSRIDAVALGESRPRVRGGDGRHDRRNRFVQVQIVESTCSM